MSRKHGQTTYYVDGEGFVGGASAAPAGAPAVLGIEEQPGQNVARAFRFSRMFGELPAFTPADDGLIALARKTVWQEVAPDTHHGLGQRIITTDAGDVPLLELRTLVVGAGAAAAPSETGV